MFNRGIFRKEALERLSTPEQLDQLPQVTGSMSWLFLLTLSGLIVGAFVWSFLGRIPVTVEGKGILIRPKHLLPLQSPISGQLVSWKVQVGECVKQDAILATVNPSDLKQQLQLSQEKLLNLKEQRQAANELSQQRLTLETENLLKSRQNLSQQLQDANALAPKLQQEEINAIRDKQTSLQEQLVNAQKIAPLLKQNLARIKALHEEGGVQTQSLLDAERNYYAAQESIATLTAQLTQLKVEETKAQQNYRDTLANIGTLEQQLQELATRQKRLDQEELNRVNQQDQQVQEISREIDRLKQQIVDNSTVRSPTNGCIVETTLSIGQVLHPGSQLGTMQVEGREAPLIGVSYFAVKDGKLVQPGMSIQVTPDTVKRQRFGGIVGKVKQVSAFPITKEGVTLLVGNPEVAASLLTPQPTTEQLSGAGTVGMIEVVSELQRSDTTVSGWQWSSSQGPSLQITSNTTVTSRITVEEQAPIAFVLPILRDWTGIY
ncbi:NHLP bacteriocin system secretion protein [Pantanalinema sp. GBBB05]|uniref:NHLP bacteriocin system secretion protein n=1 Tax=Pantanalinema sp. GBBB05 TaxID=2604139 RepID=UPI001D2F21E4|nr:NHLP bacteriocin system secretion protein [Pantanalinema sp. GBBB05]